MARMSRSERRKRTRLSMPEVSLTPLIDTALTLLIIFMVTTPMIQNAIKVELPKGNVQEAGGVQQDLVVYVDKQEKLFFNESAITESDLIKALQKIVATEKNRTVFVKADKNVHYGYVLELVNSIKDVGGVQYVALATQRRTS